MYACVRHIYIYIYIHAMHVFICSKFGTRRSSAMLYWPRTPTVLHTLYGEMRPGGFIENDAPHGHPYIYIHMYTYPHIHTMS